MYVRRTLYNPSSYYYCTLMRFHQFETVKNWHEIWLQFSYWLLFAGKRWKISWSNAQVWSDSNCWKRISVYCQGLDRWKMTLAISYSIPQAAHTGIFCKFWFGLEIILKGVPKKSGALFNRCGHVVRDFESEEKTRCNF